MDPIVPDQTDLESQLGSLLRSGRTAGFSSERFDQCLRLIAQISSPASQKAWFDLFYEQWTDFARTPDCLQGPLKESFEARLERLRAQIEQHQR
ncbi:hypothetical protein FBQ96_09420 [Nitrospirales bacterium NOB]|nr:hypothetical protein [Nitrospirales bacterium NOB]